MTKPETWIFDPKSKYDIGTYSFMVPGPNPGVLVCAYGGETLDELKAQGKVSPEAFECSWEEASRLTNDLARQRHCKGPSRVTEERWRELLEVLYPARWEHLEGSEVFMMPECITGTLYIFGVRIGEDYFSITEDCKTPAAKLVEMCRKVQ